MPTVYVSPTGSGTGDGSSIANSATLSDLTNLITAAGAGGKVVLLADQGTYQVTNQLTFITSGGTDGHPVQITGEDSAGNAMNALIQGDRADPYDPDGDAGPQVFGLGAGADNLSFSHIDFKNVGNGAIRVGGDISNLVIEDITATNVQRLVENQASGTASTATISGLTIKNVSVDGFSKGVVRLQYDTHDVLIENVVGDSEHQDGDNFAIGVHIAGTAHDITLNRVTMRNAQDTLSSGYWNGDGFAAEGGAYNITFNDTISSGNTDAGYDIKSANTVMNRAIAEDNARNYRLWAEDTVVTDAISLSPNLRGGTKGTENHIWMGQFAEATVNNILISGTETSYAINMLEGHARLTLNDAIIMRGATAPLLRTASGSVLTNNNAQYGSVASDGTVNSEQTTGQALYVNDGTGHVFSPSSGADAFVGGTGNDTLYGAAGDDRLVGGAGDDMLIGGDGSDVLIGGAGFDIASYAGSTSNVNVTLGVGAPTGDAAGDLLDGIEGLVGSAFDDTLTGDRQSNLLIGGLGSDLLDGGQGDDYLVGGGGADNLVGGDGVDTADYADSEAGVTINLLTGVGSGGDAEGDQLRGIEALVGSAHADTFVGGVSDAYFVGGGGADTMIGGLGTDTVDYSGNAVGVDIDLASGVTLGGDATGDQLVNIDVIVGSAFADTISGDATSNVLVGGAGNDYLDGREGDDRLVSGAGADSLVGGAGIDTVDYSSYLAGVTVNLATGTASDGSGDADTLAEIENVVGTAHNDILIGDGADNLLVGDAGNDDLAGGGGADTLSGGAGEDTANYSGSAGAITLDLSHGRVVGSGDADGDVFSSIEIVVGSGFDDVLTAGGTVHTLIGGIGNDVLTGGSGDDLLIGGVGADILDGNAGINTASYATSESGVSLDLGSGTGLLGDAAGDQLHNIQRVVGSAFADTLVGDSQDNIFVGGAGADTLIGGGGNDSADYSGSAAAVTINLLTGTGDGGDATGDSLVGISRIIGSKFADQLAGGDGDEVFVGGAGGDRIDGGAGNDTVDYSNSAGGVTVNLATNKHAGLDAVGDNLVNIESVIGSGSADVLTGNAEVNRLVGGEGGDVLDGGAGGDILVGGRGDDQYVVDSQDDVVVEDAGSGTDKVMTTLSSYTLGENVENLAYTGLGNFAGIGNALANTFYGAAGNDSFYGYAGNDNFQATLGADVYDGGEGDDKVDYSKSKSAITINLTTNVNVGGYAEGDMLYSVNQVVGSDYLDYLTGSDAAEVLFGRSGDDVLSGMGGNDKLDGGAGNNMLIGGSGDDTYVVRGLGDQVVESADGGIDAVVTNTTTYTLQDNVENLSVNSIASFVGYGNALDNRIVGNLSVDQLYGGAGNDTLVGLQGADRLFGGEGSDTVDYQASMIGISVNLATNINHGGDAEGDVFDSIENVVGSSLADRVVGNAAANIITGGGGNDTLDGGAGIDTLVLSGGRADYRFSTVDNHLVIQDLRAGAPDGTDTVSNFETIKFAPGNYKPLRSIEGTSASDTLTGTERSDVFLFDTALGLSLGTDQIRNFQAGDLVVTTSAMTVNSSGKVASDRSDRFVLPGTAGDASQSTGTLKIYASTGKALSGLKLVDTETQNGVTFYKYSIVGDTTTPHGLDFFDVTQPTVAISANKTDLKAGDSALLTLSFSEAVTGLSASSLVAETGTFGALTATSDPKIFTINYTPAANVNDHEMVISIAAGAYADQSGNAGVGSQIIFAVDTEQQALPVYVGQETGDTFAASSDAAWMISGMGGNDVLSGAGGADTLSGGLGDDSLTGAAGNDLLDGGAGTDTAIFSGARGDYSFTKHDGQITVSDLRLDAPDGTDTLVDIEALLFQSGSNKPNGAIEGTQASNILTGTNSADIFFFDTATGMSIGNDTIRSFGAGDRFVTTTQLEDSNNDGRIKVNASDRFVLPSIGDSVDASGTLKITNGLNRPVSTIVFEGSYVDHNIHYYVYGALGDVVI